MNFKFLFNNNIIDNRLMLLRLPDEDLPFNPTPNPWSTLGAADVETEIAHDPPIKVKDKNAGYTWKTRDGLNLKDFGWEYDTSKSAAYNRKNLKNLLKDLGLGDKADATGMISEYLQSQDPTKVKGEDRKWMNSRRGQYGYTTDANGNRDYHKTGSNWGRTLATIAGGLVMGPTGAMIGNLLFRNNKPNKFSKGFYNPTSVTPKPVKKTRVVSRPIESVTVKPMDPPQNIKTIDPVDPKYQPTPDEMWVDNTTAFGFKGNVSGEQGTGGYVNIAEWDQNRTKWYNDNWRDQLGARQLSEFDTKFGENNYTAQYDPLILQYRISPIREYDVPARKRFLDSRYGQSNWTPVEGKEYAYTYNPDKAPLRVEGNLMYKGGKQIIGFRPKGYSPHYIYRINGDNLVLLGDQILDLMKFENGKIMLRNLYKPEEWVEFNPNGRGFEYIYSNAKGGVLKYQQGGQLTDLDRILLASTLSLIGYALSQGKLIQIEEAVSLISLLAYSQPEALQELASNKELINIGIKVVGPEVVLKLSQPGVMSLLFTNSSNKSVKAMKGTKLNYIKELKGVCPEGYEMQYFSAGGNLCHRCMKKVEEAKCGKKMKKHEDGGPTGGVSKTANDIKKDIKDSKMNQRPLPYQDKYGNEWLFETKKDSAEFRRLNKKWGDPQTEVEVEKSKKRMTPAEQKRYDYLRLKFQSGAHGA